MLDESLIATLEKSLHETRNAQNRLIARLREVENEARQLRDEIRALENSAAQTEAAIDSLLMTMRSRENSNIGESSYSRPAALLNSYPGSQSHIDSGNYPVSSQSLPNVAPFNRRRHIPSKDSEISPVSRRFADRTITQACTLLLREAGGPMHVNELYNLLVAGGMEFKGKNPTISVAVSLNRNKRFRRVGPGTFDLVIRDAARVAS
ncbi:MAG TPA: hypothetical protein VNK26_05320 [Pyrinomonadaceae bacterium]|nr:hypothetical protein [Pyrinomonadaceae bacterium]